MLFCLGHAVRSMEARHTMSAFYTGDLSVPVLTHGLVPAENCAEL